MIQTLCLISILSAFSIVTCQVNLSFIGNAVQVSYVNRTTATDFIVVANISGSVDINNCWVGIGFNVAPKMVFQLSLTLFRDSLYFGLIRTELMWSLV